MEVSADRGHGWVVRTKGRLPRTASCTSVEGQSALDGYLLAVKRRVSWATPGLTLTF